MPTSRAFFDDQLRLHPGAVLAQTHVAVTPGVDFDPLRAPQFIRFCYAGAAQEAVERIAAWLAGAARARRSSARCLSHASIRFRPRLLRCSASRPASCTVLALFDFGLFVAQVTGSFVLAGVAFVTHEQGAATKVLAIPLPAGGGGDDRFLP